MREGPYKGRGYDCEGKPFVDGPGNGFGYYAGTLWPSSRMPSLEVAEAVAVLCNEAYARGAENARAKIRETLGV